MGIDFSTQRFTGRDWTASHSRGRVLLREPERCAECNKVFISLYALRTCGDHEGLEEL